MSGASSLVMWVCMELWRTSVFSMPQAENTPGGMAGTTILPISSSPDMKGANIGPEPPYAIRVKSLGSYPLWTETRSIA